MGWLKARGHRRPAVLSFPHGRYRLAMSGSEVVWLIVDVTVSSERDGRSRAHLTLEPEAQVRLREQASVFDYRGA